MEDVFGKVSDDVFDNVLGKRTNLKSNALESIKERAQEKKLAEQSDLKFLEGGKTTKLMAEYSLAKYKMSISVDEFMKIGENAIAVVHPKYKEATKENTFKICIYENEESGKIKIWDTYLSQKLGECYEKTLKDMLEEYFLYYKLTVDVSKESLPGNIETSVTLQELFDQGIEFKPKVTIKLSECYDENIYREKISCIMEKLQKLKFNGTFTINYLSKKAGRRVTRLMALQGTGSDYELYETANSGKEFYLYNEKAEEESQRELIDDPQYQLTHVRKKMKNFVEDKYGIKIHIDHYESKDYKMHLIVHLDGRPNSEENIFHIYLIDDAQTKKIKIHDTYSAKLMYKKYKTKLADIFSDYFKDFEIIINSKELVLPNKYGLDCTLEQLIEEEVEFAPEVKVNIFKCEDSAEEFWNKIDLIVDEIKGVRLNGCLFFNYTSKQTFVSKLLGKRNFSLTRCLSFEGTGKNYKCEEKGELIK